MQACGILKGRYSRCTTYRLPSISSGKATPVAHVPELDVSSCGETQEKARANIKDAVRGFLEAAENKGTLDEILEEAGYQHVGNEWNAPEFVGVDRVTMKL